MDAGKMNRRLTIKRKIVDSDTFGEPIETWVTVATIWGEKKPLRGAERYAGRQVVADISEKFFIWWRPDILVKDKIECEGKTYDIEELLEIGFREGLEIRATAGIE